ncbi:hypothetical protein NDU88_005705 [Pleurodeles waltl]|uniref:Uncharacterized protein n=1 Tax=Pleurodeles waltl TaxID=8319 RepID=A0AAV7NPT1_PLEWA|nr:hypothetical protein NDU88_005705 [Pleurodeles waltl]
MQVLCRFPLWKSDGVVPGGPCVDVPAAPQVPCRSFPREVERRRSGSVSGEFFTAAQAVRLIFRRTRSPVAREKSFWS